MRGCKDLQQRLLNTPIDHRRNSELAKSSRRLRNFHATHRRRSIRPQEQQLANPRGGTWAGEELSSDPEFFVPLHVAHLEVWCPRLFPFWDCLQGGGSSSPTGTRTSGRMRASWKSVSCSLASALIVTTTPGVKSEPGAATRSLFPSVSSRRAVQMCCSCWIATSLSS